MNLKRIRKLNDKEFKTGPIVLWISRDQRFSDNWALVYAQELSNKFKQPVIVCFCLVPNFLDATFKQYDFMINGLIELEKKFTDYNFPFILLSGNPVEELSNFISEVQASCLITDFDPLKIKREWKNNILNKIYIPFFEVDTHNIVPVWEASPKLEYGAYTIRNKIKRQLPEFLEEFPSVNPNEYDCSKYKYINNWDLVYRNLEINFEVKPVDGLKSGEEEAKLLLQSFIEEKLCNYSKDRNNPNVPALSNLSPYLHFGQISSQRIAIEVNKSNFELSKESFLEELIVRKELSDNFCYYNSDYDNFNGLPNWAKQSLNNHRSDIRSYIYSLEEFESAKTHDLIWNACQNEMKIKGKMHGYLRMYWAKKILEWTRSPEDAIKIAIYLNDKYELDGRDPNGYVGILWSIGGLHDRAWKDREVFGKVRYMSYNGLKSKFDIKLYIDRFA